MPGSGQSQRDATLPMLLIQQEDGYKPCKTNIPLHWNALVIPDSLVLLRSQTAWSALLQPLYLAAETGGRNVRCGTLLYMCPSGTCSGKQTEMGKMSIAP